MLARLELAVDLARRAGGSLCEGYRREKVIKYKGRTNLLTEYDLRSEAMVVEGILSAFPEDAIVAEEGGAIGEAEEHWLIDPLDGTTNFAHGMPAFTVCIAYVRGLDPLLGVIYDPIRDELFSAIRDGGARLNGEPIRVSSARELGESLLSTGFPYEIEWEGDDNFERWERAFRASRGVRHLGCASLNLAYVAAGRLDGYWESRLHPWDLASGVLLVQEAGGRVTRVDGGPEVLAAPCSVLATNGHLYGELLSLLGA